MPDQIILVEEIQILAEQAESSVLHEVTENVLILTDSEQGPTGPAGTSDLSYTHTQGTAAAEWLITHAMGKRPAVTVVDSAGDVVEGDVVYIDANSLQITFSSAFAGLAFLN